MTPTRLRLRFGIFAAIVAASTIGRPVAGAESEERVRLEVAATAGHLEVGDGAGDEPALGSGGVAALAAARGGLMARAALIAFVVDGRGGTAASLVIGYRSSRRLWWRIGGGVGRVFYDRIDRELGGTQSGEPRDPADSLGGLAFDVGVGVDVWRAPGLAIDLGAGLDVVHGGPDVIATDAALQLGVAWR